MAVKVESTEDWQKVSQIGGPVVDPMILRCGEVFLLGPNATANESDEWALLDINLHALGTFFDRIVLDEHIPVFDYTASFQVNPNFNKSALSEVNDRGEVLVEVNVSDCAYIKVKSLAEEKLIQLYAKGEYGIAAGEANSILGELSTAGYTWYPYIPDIPFYSDAERQLGGYILAGLIFGGYAQLAGADHLMQPKRSRLFLATPLRAYGPRSEEDHLFDTLNQLPALKTAEIPFTPTFFPMLLHQSSNPRQLLAVALQLRNTSEVREYREWLQNVLDDFGSNGRISVKVTQEVNAILQAVRRRSEAFKFPNIEFKTTVSGLVGTAEAELSVDLAELAASAWGWFVEQLPGRRYRKLLSRAIVLENEYVDLRRRAETVWRSQG
jgi:hypothetical protein